MAAPDNDRRTTTSHILAGFQLDPASSVSERAQKAIYLARSLQARASELQTPQERRQQSELDRMIHSPQDKVTLTQLTDQAFRSNKPHRAADQLIHILDVQGIPRFFTPLDRTLLKGFQSFGGYLPGVAVPLVKEKMQRETANVILPAEREMLTEYLEQRRSANVRMNVNFLGEALLGEEEAQHRLNNYLEALQIPEIEVISVKISTLYSQISALAREHAVDHLCDRMELLFRAAAKERFSRGDGTTVAKFVYLDMEEYRDMRITSEVFMRTLDRPGLHDVTGGIALQAYVPDSFLVQQELTSWAVQRVQQGGAPITVRIVKGANMEMERVEATLRGWPPAPYATKLETDANYKCMLHFGMQPAHRAAVRLGIASHNLFELAYALICAVEEDALDVLQFEMLEGMANHQRRALFELVENLMLYAPACRQEDFIHAVGYLFRRLDENTGHENFLRHAFKLHVDSPEWEQLENGFRAAFAHVDSLDHRPRRTQDRRQPPDVPSCDQPFTNEPDTDFSLPHNSVWAQQLVDQTQQVDIESVTQIPLVIDGNDILEARTVRDCIDPSRPDTCVASYRQATADDVGEAVESARRDADGWRSASAGERRKVLRAVAQNVRSARGALIAAALVDGGKTVAESDAEVSEAVDFVEYYSRSAEQITAFPGLRVAGRGVVVVVSPWNFPIAIPCGGVAAALAAGNTVILKPASDTVLVAYRMCQCFWDAGVSRRVLQFLPCAGATEGQQLASHSDVDVVILTGGTATALAMMANQPEMNLLAETGGKNATIVTALADRDQAIKHVVHSAFSHSGQKCSATSLLILEAEVYDDAKFKRSLCDAVRSLHVGPAFELHNRMGPLIRAPAGDLDRGLKELEPGESWAVMPERSADNPRIYTPGIKWGVQPGSYTHMIEFFGPLLGVMCAGDLVEAIQFANHTGYGLTAGLESLDNREQEYWRENIFAGNLYVNRPTTGAVVLRQPFGGRGKSAFGPGIKAGGPNYLVPLMTFDQSSADRDHRNDAVDPQLLALLDAVENLGADHPDVDRKQLRQVRQAASSYAHHYAEEYSQVHDHFRLLGQDNLRRYLAVQALRIRIHSSDNLFDIFARVAAAKTAGCRMTISSDPRMSAPLVDLLDDLTVNWGGTIEFVDETEEELAEIVGRHDTERLRYAGPDRVSDVIRRAAPLAQVYVADSPVLEHGRIELLWYLVEQSISVDYHRYGNLGDRATEKRTESA